jgi:methylated-DNA-[protein]-cysteine S-methyltransferase
MGRWRSTICRVESPVGPLTIAAHGHSVCILHFGARERAVYAVVKKWYPGEAIARDPDPAGAVSALRAYFDGDLTALDGVGVELNGTPFQRRVWEALRTVRAGTTASYSEIARRIGAAAAVRAVGAANGANPVAIIVPCHRIIGANGSLTGYGGGLERKQWLLRHEQPQRSFFPSV